MFPRVFRIKCWRGVSSFHLGENYQNKNTPVPKWTLGLNFPTDNVDGTTPTDSHQDRRQHARTFIRNVESSYCFQVPCGQQPIRLPLKRLASHFTVLLNVSLDVPEFILLMAEFRCPLKSTRSPRAITVNLN